LLVLGRTAPSGRRLRGLDGHGLDLDEQLWLHETGDDEQRVGRIDAAGEVTGKDLVAGLHEALDVGGMGQERLEADHVAHAGARCLEHGPHVVERLLRLGSHVAGAHDLARAIQAHLARHHHDLTGRRGHAMGVHAEGGAEIL
jgi:hypothetical protein